PALRALTRRSPGLASRRPPLRGPTPPGKAAGATPAARPTRPWGRPSAGLQALGEGGQGRALDLADALARQAEAAADLLERQRPPAAQAEAQSQHGGLAGGHRLPQAQHLAPLAVVGRGRVGRLAAQVRQQLVERAALLLAAALR